MQKLLLKQLSLRLIPGTAQPIVHDRVILRDGNKVFDQLVLLWPHASYIMPCYHHPKHACSIKSNILEVD